jgi:hypothetical protein
MLAPENRGCQQGFRMCDGWRLVAFQGENGDGGEGAEPGADGVPARLVAPRPADDETLLGDHHEQAHRRRL